jgi:hypothetical protein
MRTNRSRLRCLAVAGLVALTSCTYTGESGNPVARSLTWFSFVGGEDIRAACDAGAPDHFRFVYNGHYRLQIRAYDLAPVAGGGELSARARGRGGDVGKFSFDEPLGPWTLDRGVVRLDNDEAAAIVDALSDAAAKAPPAAGQSMQSYEFFWIVTSCSAGRFGLHVFRWPELAIDTLPFVPLLLAHDRTGVPFQPTRQVEGMQEYSFGIAINAAGNGLVGL